MQVLFLSQEIFDLFLVDDCFFKSISAGLGTSHRRITFVQFFASAAALASFVLMAVFAAFAMFLQIYVSSNE